MVIVCYIYAQVYTFIVFFYSFRSIFVHKYYSFSFHTEMLYFVLVAVAVAVAVGGVLLLVEN